ncbi:thiol-disulfide isomerase/thioredoxin [Chitinophaga niastensis]|uniref:Thiol-disulfide isomerase/thioredoxin n=1 Tax=Chitinophaga niastensis TaxID=536980 RepID=A0A2P8HQ97_CHINA|nr:TlpA disulfide reductase family protein [Chitinophaga niastensis]PSL48388.1 thiol-disulfide isomerase/thioredoxin [Chitinophaga niastensis]
MNKPTIIMAGSLLLASLQGLLAQQKPYTVTANIKGQGDYKVTLNYHTAKGAVRDTPQVINGDQFIFKGNVEGPVLVTVISGHPASRFEMSKGGMFVPAPRLEFILTGTSIRIDGDATTLYKATVKGGKENDELNALKKKTLPLTQKSWEMKQQSLSHRRPEDSTLRKELMAEMGKTADQTKEVQKQFVATHPASYVSITLLTTMYSDYTAAEYEKVFNNLAPAYKETFLGKYVAGKVAGTKATELGATAINFTKTDNNGQPFTLSSLKGKYVLLDFWGSWCGPCRASHPHLKELYTEYKGKGLEIVGIADEKAGELEQAKGAWLKAIQGDGLPWIQVLNNFGKEKDDLVTKYAISGFPTKILLDKDGKIIFKIVGAGGTDLDEALKKVF